MQAQENPDGISLKQVQVLNWLLMVIMAGSAWLMYSRFVAFSVAVGGAVANVSFHLLKKDLIRLLSGSRNAVKVLFFIKYYARLAVLVVLLFFLVKYQKVHVIGLLLGLSTVLLSIGVTVAGEAKKFYFNVKEAS